MNGTANGELLSVEQVNGLLAAGKKMILAGDEALLARVRPGEWIGGTSAYFMAKEGGVCSQDKIFVTELPAVVTSVAIKRYTAGTISAVHKDLPGDGFGVLIIPAMSSTHSGFALGSPHYEGFATRPLVGWISGVHLNELGKKKPKVFAGDGQGPAEDGAVVMHVRLPATKYAEVKLVNIFRPGTGDEITFPESAFSATRVLVNGKPDNLAEYFARKNLDTRLPLVANYCGAMVNTSLQTVDADKKQVAFYAPVFRGITYKHAAPINDYLDCFRQETEKTGSENIAVSCNCILNYVNGKLEGRKTGVHLGPITFGEIAYQLVNQTMTYVVIGDATTTRKG